MQKRRHTRFLAAGLAATALALGSLVPATTSAVAEDPGADATMAAVYDDGWTSVLEIVTTPDRVGESVVILHGWAPGTGNPVAGATIEPGATYVATPAPAGMVATAMGETFMVVSSNVDFPPEGD